MADVSIGGRVTRLPADVATSKSQISIMAWGALGRPHAARAFGAGAVERLSTHLPRHRRAAFCLPVLLALFINAAICSIFSHPVDRYQSRFTPLALFAITLLASKRGIHLGCPADLS
jgi:hypothetical protein